MTFEPIAIVGQACVLPGALTPFELWENIKAGKDLLSNAKSLKKDPSFYFPFIKSLSNSFFELL